MKLKTEHIVLGAVAVIGVVGGAAYLKQHHMLSLAARSAESEAARIRHNSRTPGMPYRARMAHGKTATNPGVANVGLGSGTVGGWTAAGHNAGLNPSAWSYLTARNENYTYAHTPTNRLLRPARLGVNAMHKVQGSEGYTSHPWNAIYTYF